MSGANERKKSQKGPLKEKVLQVYEKLFQGQDITQGRAEFWDDFFLLKANIKCLVAHFEKLTVEDLVCVKPQLNRLFLQCLHTARTDRHRIRIANSIQTMDALLVGLYKCKSVPNTTSELNEFLLSPEYLTNFTENYINLCSELIREDRPEKLRSLIFNSLLTFTSIILPLNKNPFLSGFLNDRIYDIIYGTLTNSQLRYYHGLSACRLLGYLLQYNKDESTNLFLSWLCQTDDDLLLNNISSTIALALSEFNLRFRQQHDSSGGILSSFSSFLSSLVSGDITSSVSLRPCDTLMLCLFALAKSSNHFVTFLSYSNGHYTETRGFDTIMIPDPVLDHRLLKAVSTESMVGYISAHAFSPGKAVPILDNCDKEVLNLGINSSSPENLSSPDRSFTEWNLFQKNPTFTDFDTDVGRLNLPLEPRNLLADLLEYCSIVMQDVKTLESLNSCHICLIIIGCITQNRLACSLLHDSQTSFKVRIHKTRSRKSSVAPYSIFTGRPIAMAIMDLIVEFARGHLMKKLPHRLYRLCFSICHNLLCYQKKHKIRLEFDWKQLWSVILSLLKFVLNLDSNIFPPIICFQLIEKALQIFNFFILHGDSFLQAADIYDNLYYELIRMHTLIENLYEHALSHSTSSSADVKEMALAVILQLGNLRSIVNHFNTKIIAFQTTNNVTSLTENQVLSVVRDNYDSLNLRLLENLDVPEQIVLENEDLSLFTNLIETITKQLRKECFETSLQIQTHLHELSAIP